MNKKNIIKAVPYGVSAAALLALIFVPVFSNGAGEVFSVWSLLAASLAFFGSMGEIAAAGKLLGADYPSMINTYGVLTSIFTVALFVMLTVGCVLAVLKTIRTCSNDDATAKNPEINIPLFGFAGYVVLVKFVVPLIFNTAIGRKAPQLTSDSVSQIISKAAKIPACDATWLSVAGYITVAVAVAAAIVVHLKGKKEQNNL